jgi:hypothetical protein
MIKKRIYATLITICLLGSLLPAALAAPAAKTLDLGPYTTEDGVLVNATVTMPVYYGTIELPIEMYDDTSGEWVVETKTCDVVGLDADGHAFSVKVDSAVKGAWVEATEVTYIPPRMEGGTCFTAEYGTYDKWYAEGDTIYCGSFTGVNDYYVYYDYSGQERYYVHSDPILVLTDEMIAYFMENGTLSSNDPYTYPGLLELLTKSGAAAPVTTPVEDPTANSKIAYAGSSTVLVDGKSVTFDMYALLDANGNPTNYVKLRDIAHILDGTAAQFNVGWNGAIELTTGVAYTSRNGSEMSTPFDGNQRYELATSDIYVNGALADLEAITLTDSQGGSYNYFKLRDLGRALGFNVSWSSEANAIIINSDEPYSG